MNLWNCDEKRRDEGIGILEGGMTMLANFSSRARGCLYIPYFNAQYFEI